MKILPLVRTEFARLTSSRLGLASLIALMIVPVVYGGLYLWGNQDPYNNLEKVPAAIVVADTGATLDGKAVNYGQDAAKTLVDGKRFGWHVVSASAAKKGVTKGTYDFSITFPAAFSSSLVSAGGSAPKDARLVLTTNDINSYLSTTLAKQATEAVRVSVAQQVAKSGSRTLLDGVASVRSGLVDARDGASDLADGAASASSGASSLASGAGSLSSGLAKLDSSASSLPAGAARLNAGAKQLSNGISVGASGQPSLVSATQQVAALTPQVRAQIAAVFAGYHVDPATQAGILAELDGLSSASTKISGGISTLATGAKTLAAGTNTLAASAPSLSSAIHSAAIGASSLSSGAASLSTGVAKLASGSTTLHDSLTKGVDKVPATTAAERAATAKTLSNPVLVKQHAITEAQNYGAGLAPFFISLSAWIGIYALFLIVRPLSRRALTAVRRPIRTTIAGWLTPAVFGVVQMVALFAIITLALHLQIAHPFGLLAFMAFVSITFAAIVLALNVLLGSVGQFLGLLLMIVQLVTAGGTFPWQTLPGPLAALHQTLPMSSAVNGVRQLMYGGTAGDLWAAILPLLGWLLAGLAVSALGALRQGRLRTLRELRPSAIGG